VSASAKTHPPAARGATTGAPTVAIVRIVAPTVVPTVVPNVVPNVARNVKEAAAATGAIHTQGATARETAATVVSVANAMAMTVARGDATEANAAIDLAAEMTAAEGVDEREEEEAGVEAEEETSARSRLRPSQSSASLPQISSPLRTSRTARAA
jgi:hypothetical protein